MKLISADFNIKEYSEGLYSKVKEIPDTTLVKGVPVGKKFFVDARNINVFKKMRKFDGAALIIHGTADERVPISFAEKANKELSGAKLERVDGAGNELNDLIFTFRKHYPHLHYKKFIINQTFSGRLKTLRIIYYLFLIFQYIVNQRNHTFVSSSIF